jgi:hypothetical protein
MLAVWAIASWLQQGKFDAALRNVFDRDPHADVTVFWAGLTYIAGPFFSLVFASAYAFLGILLLRRPYEWVPVIAVLLSVPVAAVAVFTYIFSGRWYISAIGTGPDKSAAIREMGVVDHLTQWRFTGWYHSMSVGFGLAIISCLAGAAALLVTATSKPQRE